MTCILIDDEHHALEALEQLITKTPLLKPLGSFTDAESAMAFLQGNGKVDIIFSDISMPDVDGITAGRLMKQYSLFLVYITGYREHALDAYEVGADAYLMKPLGYTAFMEKLEELALKHRQFAGKSTGTNEEWLFVKGAHKSSFIKIKIADIVYIRSMGNYVHLHSATGHHTTYMNLKEIEQKLQDQAFQRVNKSTVISIRYLDRVENNMVYLSAGEESRHPIGDAYRESFLSFIRLYR